MEIIKDRPFYEISDEELNSKLDKLRAQGLTKAEIAKTQEGKEHCFRALTDRQIINICNKKCREGLELMDVPEYQERVRRRNIADMEGIQMANPDIFGGDE